MHNAHPARDSEPSSGGRRADDAGAPASEELRTVVRHCLDDADDLVSRYVAQVSTFDDDQGKVPDEDLRETARACFELRLAGGPPVTDGLRAVPERLGRRRARQGDAAAARLTPARRNY
ncbi:hypothetical protein ACWGJT_35150 [Streptomyces xantholiticus]